LKRAFGPLGHWDRLYLLTHLFINLFIYLFIQSFRAYVTFPDALFIQVEKNNDIERKRAGGDDKNLRI
jgi:hypothetical protein